MTKKDSGTAQTGHPLSLIIQSNTGCCHHYVDSTTYSANMPTTPSRKQWCNFTINGKIYQQLFYIQILFFTFFSLASLPETVDLSFLSEYNILKRLRLFRKYTQIMQI